MGYIKWNIDPVIFDTGVLSPHYYSLFFALGFILSYRVLHQVFMREKVSEELLSKLSVYVIAATLIGARLGHCLFYEANYYLAHPLEIILPFSWTDGKFRITGIHGLASHGGAIGILAGLLFYVHKYKISLLWLLDRLSIVIPLCGACIRIGNFFNSEIIGKPSSMPWAVIFERVDQVPRHPAQLYEAFCYLGLFLLFRYIFRKYYKQLRPGQLFGYFIISLFSIRFLIEFLKENQEDFEHYLPFNMGQLLSIPFIICGVYLIFRRQEVKIMPSNNSHEYTSNNSR
jgi:prolipoprotein diacylglyceryl transferase